LEDLNIDERITLILEKEGVRVSEQVPMTG
jgi:hypothetical protein